MIKYCLLSVLFFFFAADVNAAAVDAQRRSRDGEYEGGVAITGVGFMASFATIKVQIIGAEAQADLFFLDRRVHLSGSYDANSPPHRLPLGLSGEGYNLYGWIYRSDVSGAVVEGSLNGPNIDRSNLSALLIGSRNVRIFCGTIGGAESGAIVLIEGSDGVVWAPFTDILPSLPGAKVVGTFYGTRTGDIASMKSSGMLQAVANFNGDSVGGKWFDIVDGRRKGVFSAGLRSCPAIEQDAKKGAETHES